MKIELCGATFENVEAFENFLIEKLKDEYKGEVFDFLDDYLGDVIYKYRKTGSTSYELAGWDTKSGIPEAISFDVENRFYAVQCGIDFEVPPGEKFNYATTYIKFQQPSRRL